MTPMKPEGNEMLIVRLERKHVPCDQTLVIIGHERIPNFASFPILGQHYRSPW